MTKTLIIAEKPSVAQDIVRALTPVAGKFDKQADHFENDRYVVTSAVGHLVEIQAPEEFDVALAIARFEEVMDWPVVRVERTWAGLRNFAPDRLPVFGADPQGGDFFWCAGQGGFGIQTAPAIADLLAAEILGQQPGAEYGRINPAAFAPGRESLRS